VAAVAGSGGRTTAAAGDGEASAPAGTPAPPLTFIDRRVAALFPPGVVSAAGAGKLRLASAVVAVLVVVVALVTLYICFETGESGARAAWAGR
jgi:hypothetical protein